jgi:hypothetical protein
MDPHYFGKLDPDPAALQSKFRSFRGSKNGAVDANNGAVEGRRRSQWRRGGIKWNPGRSVDQWWSQIRITLMRSRIQIRIQVKSRIRIDVKRCIRIRIFIKLCGSATPVFNFYLF